MKPERPAATQTSGHSIASFSRREQSANLSWGGRRKSILLLTAFCAGVSGTLACADGARGPTSPSAQSAASSLSAGPEAGQTSASNGRSGAFHLTKECSENTGLPGSFCTVTSSNVDAIEVGSRIIYAESPGATTLDTDIVLDLPGPGNNKAYGHCAFTLATRRGECILTGGTGKFTWFQARADVSHLGGPDWEWAGTFSFRPHD